ncbi:MAG TPA: serine/threonine-protein kinase [Kofleriaceae bacterium]
MPAEGGIRFGPYLLQRRIARGPIAEVFLAHQRVAGPAGRAGPAGLDRRVALKRIRLHPADGLDLIEMSLDEARFATRLSHPGLVQIYDVGQIDGYGFIAMEYVDGIDARRLRDAAERPSPAMVARIGADAAAALHHAHGLRTPAGQSGGVVHRNLSPANVMVSFDGAVKLCDLGIEKAIALGHHALTGAGVVERRSGYLSPEQIVAAPLDGRSDVYALAIVLWELLAGTTLVPRGDAVAAMHAIRSGRLPALAEAAPWTPAPLAEAIAWGLAIQREQRATAAQLGQALEAFLEASPELATPAQLGDWLRQRFARDPGEPLDELADRDLDRATPSPSMIALDHSETLLRSGAFRVPVPSGPALAPTLIEARPASELAAAPMPAAPMPAAVMPTAAMPAAAMPAAPRGRSRTVPPALRMPPATRIAMMALGMSGLALLSFAIAVAVHGSPRGPADRGAMFASRDSSAGNHASSRAVPVAAADAAPDAAAPDAQAADAPAGATPTALPAVPAGATPGPPPGPAEPLAPRAAPPDALAPVDAAGARLDVHTDPAGATVAIYRCADPALPRCRPPDGTGKVDGCAAAQCSFRLPPGRYEIAVELAGARETRQVALTGDVTTALDIVLGAAARAARSTTGRLTVRTRQPCDAVLDAHRRHLQTPIVELELRPGAHKLELSCGGAPITRSVAIAAGQTTELTIAR